MTCYSVKQKDRIFVKVFVFAKTQVKISLRKTYLKT